MNAKICELCGKRSAKYICQECGRAICEACIEPYTWLCLDCYGKTKGYAEEKTQEILHIPLSIKLFLLSFILMFAGVLILVLTALLSGLTGSLGIILLLGPIPIIIGYGEHVIPLLILATVLTIICIVIFIFFSRCRMKL